jgi:3-isopropylmalate/(R)-2-methylmalate dehydratase small subunit
MKRFETLTAVAAPLLRDNIDTDTIIPSREMRSTGKTGLKDGLFAPWRYTDVDARVTDPAFVLNQPAFAQAQILASGANFGCGSSREHAVWALAEYGIACVIAESFAPIFYNNCVRNGVLALALPKADIAALAGKSVSVDLAAQSVICGDARWSFDIASEAKAMLLEGLDAIDLTLKHMAAIATWQDSDRAQRPWVYLENAR